MASKQRKEIHHKAKMLTLEFLSNQNIFFANQSNVNAKCGHAMTLSFTCKITPFSPLATTNASS